MSLSAQLITYKRLLEEEYGVDCRIRGPSVLGRRTVSGAKGGDYFYDDFKKRDRQSAADHRRKSDRDTDSYDYAEPKMRRGSRNSARNRKDKLKGRDDYDYYNDPAKAMPTPHGPPPKVEYEDDDAKEYYDFKPDMKRGDSPGPDNTGGTRGRLHRNSDGGADEGEDNPTAKRKAHAEERHSNNPEFGRADKSEAALETPKEGHVYPSFEDEGPLRPGSSYEYGFEEGFSKKKAAVKKRTEDDDFFSNDEKDTDYEQERKQKRRRRQDAPEVGSGHTDAEAEDEEDEADDPGEMNSGIGNLAAADDEEAVASAELKQSPGEDDDEEENPFFKGKLARAKQNRKFQRSRYKQIEDDGFEDIGSRTTATRKLFK